jgi:hypothetical protein
MAYWKSESSASGTTIVIAIPTAEEKYASRARIFADYPNPHPQWRIGKNKEESHE